MNRNDNYQNEEISKVMKLLEQKDKIEKQLEKMIKIDFKEEDYKLTTSHFADSNYVSSNNVQGNSFSFPQLIFKDNYFTNSNMTPKGSSCTFSLSKSSLNKQNYSPNMNIEYCFSPNLLVNKVTNAYKNKRKEGEAQGQNLCSTFNKIFDKTREEEEHGNKFSEEKSKVFLSRNWVKLEQKKNYCTTKKDKTKDGKYKTCLLSKSPSIHPEKKQNPIFKIEKNYYKRLSSDLKVVRLNNEERSLFDINSLTKQEIEDSSNSPQYSMVQTSRSLRMGMKYRMFPKEVKKLSLDLVDQLGGDFRTVSETYGIPIKSLKRWMNVGWQRKKGCGRKVKDPDLEAKLLMWYRGKIQGNKLPSPSDVINKAKELSKDPTFLASKGWLEKFRSKYQLSLRKRYITKRIKLKSIINKYDY